MKSPTYTGQGTADQGLTRTAFSSGEGLGGRITRYIRVVPDRESPGL